MTVLVFGGNGQVGQELLRALSPLGEVVATTRSGTLPDGSACEVADFNQPDSLPTLLDRLQPSAVINAAAYTAVDRAEQEPEAALRANAQAPGVIARWCAAHGAAPTPITFLSLGISRRKRSFRNSFRRAAPISASPSPSSPPSACGS